MFSMTIVFGNTPTGWVLLFKTQEAFNDAIINFKNPVTFDNKELDITDDYGQHIAVKRDSIQGVMFEDMAKSKLAQIDRGLHQLRTQIDADNLLKADPILSAALRARSQGPGVLTPAFGPNGAFRQ